MGQRPTIAIVDDDPSAREGIADFMTAVGYVTKAFQRPHDFLGSGCAAGFDCLITDVRMPGMSGLELLERLRASGNCIPIILITAFAEEVDRKRAFRAGATCYLAKPFADHELLACVRKALGPDGEETRP